MEYCKYCKERKAIIEVAGGMEICKDSPNRRHYFISKDYKRTTQSYNAGYAFGEYLADRLGGVVSQIF